MQITPLQDWIKAKIGISRMEFDRGDIKRYQLESIRHVIQYVSERSPFYRQHLLHLTLPQSFQDFGSFPFTTAEDLLADPSGFVCVTQDEIQRIVTLPTSGTTGTAKRIYFTAADQELTIDFFRAGMSTLAVPGDRVLILLPAQREGSVGNLLRLGLQRLGCTPFPHGPFDDEAAILRLIRENDINILVGSPVQLHRLLRWDQAFSILEHGQIQRVLVSTDTLPETIRLNLQIHWNCEVFDHYGMTETGLGGGVECAAHEGYHLREADLYYEIIDPHTGQNLPMGQPGEVVVTTLTRLGMPLVRYRTGDVSHLIPGKCSCDSFIQRMENIHARIAAGVELKSGLLYPPDLDEVLFKIESMLDFSGALVHGASSDTLRVNLLTINGERDDVSHLVMDALCAIPAIRSGLQSGTLQVDVNLVQNLPSPGKGMVKRSIPIM